MLSPTPGLSVTPFRHYLLTHHQAQEGKKSLNGALGHFVDVRGSLPAAQVRNTQGSLRKAAMLHPRHLLGAFPQRGCPEEVQIRGIDPL